MFTKNSLRFVCAFFITALLFGPAVSAKTFSGRTMQFSLQKIASGKGEFLLDFALPPNHKFAIEAPSTLTVRTKHSDILKIKSGKTSLNLSKLPHSVSYQAQEGQTIVAMDMRIHFCDETAEVCLSDFIRLKFPVQVEAGASSKTSLRIPLQSKITR